MAADGSYERDVAHRINERYTTWGGLKSVLTEDWGFEGVIVRTALYRAETWGNRSGE